MPYDNNLHGTLFKNEHKTDGDKRPEYTGKCEIDSVEYRIAAWVRTASTGKKYMSLAFELPREGSTDKENPPA